MLAAVHLVNAFPQRGPSLCPALEEAQVQDALERVCNLTMHGTAKVAAELINNSFDQNQNDNNDRWETDFGNIVALDFPSQRQGRLSSSKKSLVLKHTLITPVAAFCLSCTQTP